VGVLTMEECLKIQSENSLVKPFKYLPLIIAWGVVDQHLLSNAYVLWSIFSLFFFFFLFLVYSILSCFSKNAGCGETTTRSVSLQLHKFASLFHHFTTPTLSHFFSCGSHRCGGPSHPSTPQPANLQPLKSTPHFCITHNEPLSILSQFC
jgi:hypothetical protein